MSRPVTTLVTQTRIKQLLECYGSSVSSWPEEERPAAMNLLGGSPELKILREQIQPLDNMLMQYRDVQSNSIDQHAAQSLQQRIMDQLPDQELAEIDHNNNDNSAHHPHRLRFWAGSIAASVLVASLSLAVIKQLYIPGSTSQNNSQNNSESNSLAQLSSDIADNDFARWAWEDITGELLEAESENSSATLYALLELELPAE